MTLQYFLLLLQTYLFQSDIFTTKDSKILFGRDISLGEEFEQLDTVQDGRITFQEIFQFIEKHGIGLTSRFIGFQRNSIDTINKFLNSLLGTMQLNLKRLVTDVSTHPKEHTHIHTYIHTYRQTGRQKDIRNN